MIPRYTPSDFAELWSAKRRVQAWLEVELAACEAMERAGVVPAGTADKVRPVRDRLDPARIDEIEKTTRHDVIAFLTHVEELAGEPARWLHFGMTSSDVLDTSFAMLLRDAALKLVKGCEALIATLDIRIKEHRHTAMIGRSHGIHAEPVTFGLVLAGHRTEMDRACKRLRRALMDISVGKIAGAVGTYSHLTPDIEADALKSLGLRAEPVSTQVVARDRHASYAAALALCAAGIERLATNVRHWQRTEVGEAEEAFQAGQKGSSAMPHKRNPVLSENLCGLARVVRGAVVPCLENVSLWHERDISHSSVERIVLPDAISTLAFMLERADGLMARLVVYPEQMKANLDRTGGLWASEGILLALVRKGLPRQRAYEMVQRNAMRAFAKQGAFQALLAGDSEIATHLTTTEIGAQFSLEGALKHVDAIIDRMAKGEL